MAGDERMSEQKDFTEVDRQINEALQALDVNVEIIDRRTRNHLRKIQEALQMELEARQAAEAEVRRHNLSVASISKVSGVSHATFYNKPLLSKFVNAFRDGNAGRTETSVSNSLKKRIEALQAEIEMLNRQGAEMVQLQRENDILRQRLRVYEVQEQGGTPAADGKGEILLFKALS